MATSYGQFAVTTTPSLIVPARPGRNGFVIFNSGTTVMYVGPDAAMTYATGMQVDPHSYFQLNGLGAWPSDIYAVTFSGSTTANYWDWGA